MIDLLYLIKEFNCVSIIGMDKNVGKTTVLNNIIKGSRGKKLLGLTSIGRDGESVDRVTYTKKPKIYIEKGTLIATSKDCLYKGDVTREILCSTNITTSMGNIIIAKALSDGFVELGGPSSSLYLKEICNKLRDLGSELIVVDGAVSRKSFSSMTEGTILSTGAVVDKDIDKVVEKTKYMVDILSLNKEEDEEIISKTKEIFISYKIGLINEDGSIKNVNSITPLEGGKKVVQLMEAKTKYIVIKGTLSDKFLNDIMYSFNLCKGLKILVEDATKIFINETLFLKFKKLGGEIKVLNKTKLICVTCNPVSPNGYEFNSKEFLYKLREKIDIPVVDVIGGNNI